MADEVFALSPISARAASPTEADYDAIQTAFMETARGRWFLGEYAKRNRNADTAMVLDAVVRLEERLAASRVEAESAPPAPESPQPAADPLASARTAFAEAAAAMETALGADVFDATLAPCRRSARIVKEIGWALREAGTDSRICDLVDGQARAIDTACDSFPAASLRQAALDALQPLVALLGETAGTATTGNAAASAFEAETAEILPDGSEPASETPQPAAIAAAPASEPISPVSDQSLIETEEFLLEPSPAPETKLPAEEPGASAPVMEPGAISDIPSDAASEASPPEADSHAEEPVLEVLHTPGVEPEAAAEPVEPARSTMSTATASLGATLLAQGIVPQPRPDLMAPIRRMSQAERIAFFS